MARIQKLQVPVEFQGSFTDEQRALLQQAMDKHDIQSLPTDLIAKTRKALRQKDVAERMALPAHNWDVHTRSLRGLPSDLR